MGEEDKGSGMALLPSLAAPIAGGLSPVSCPHGGHQQPSESAASTTPCKCIGSNAEAGIEKQRFNPIQANLSANAAACWQCSSHTMG